MTTATSAPDHAVEPTPVVKRQMPAVVRWARRVPFTSAYVLITMILSIVLGTLWSDIENKSWFGQVAYGLPAFESGRWWTLVFGAFFALHPVYYLFVAGGFALLTGFAEWRLGTARTIVITVVYQFAAVLIVALAFWIFRNTGWEWVATRSTETDVGFSAGMLAVLSVASATIRPPWRLRLRLAIWTYVIFSILFVGQMADAEHLLAVVFSMPISTRLAGPRGWKTRALPTRHEVRLLAFIAVVLVAASNLIGVLLPNRLTPLGVADDSGNAWYLTVLFLVVTLAAANGLRRGYRWAWWTEIILLAVPLALLALVVVALVLGALFNGDIDVDGVPQYVASSGISIAIFVLLIAARRSFRVPRRGKRKRATGTSQPELAKDLLRRYGGDTISWMTTWPENRHMVTEDGQSYVAFVRHAGVAVALGDPVGPPENLAATVAEFVALCERAGMVPYLFSCTHRTLAATESLGWQSAQVAEDNLIDLPELEFKGKKWQDIRTALNKAPKAGIRLEMLKLADAPWKLVRQVELLSQEWLGDKKLPEMGFTLGGLTEALDPEVRVGLAVDDAGTVHGVTSWMPVYAGGGEIAGWTLDLMRRGEGNFKPAMEFLIASSCLQFKEEGAQFVSLSGAPLARSEAAAAGGSAVDRLLNTLGAALEPVYGFRSLHAFKSKFQPRLSPMYMVFRDEGDLPRIGVAITRAYLPDAKMRDMITMMRH